MIVEFGQLVSVESIADLPESFYEKFQFRVIIDGSKVSYRVEFKPENPHISNRISKEELLKISRNESGESCRSALRKQIGSKRAGNAASRTKIKAPTFKELINELPVKDNVEGELKQFLLAVVSVGAVPKFVLARLCSKSFKNDFKSPMSVLFPTRTNAGFKLSADELEKVRDLLPKCITDANDFTIKSPDGKIYVLPPFPADNHFTERKAHQKLISESRIEGFSFVKISMALTKWSRTIVPRAPIVQKTEAQPPSRPEPAVVKGEPLAPTPNIGTEKYDEEFPTLGETRAAQPAHERTTVSSKQSTEDKWIAGTSSPKPTIKPLQDGKEEKPPDKKPDREEEKLFGKEPNDFTK